MHDCFLLGLWIVQCLFDSSSRITCLSKSDMINLGIFRKQMNKTYFSIHRTDKRRRRREQGFSFIFLVQFREAQPREAQPLLPFDKGVRRG